MPFYYFHLRTAEGLDRDEIGLLYANIEAAYLGACKAIPKLLAELVQGGHDPNCCIFEITDAEGRRLIEVPFLERAKRWRPPQPPAVSPETRALLDRIDVLTRAIGEEIARLGTNLAEARAQMVTMQAITGTPQAPRCAQERSP
jgi:hypothetical protein